jgi:hypothetical protein
MGTSLTATGAGVMAGSLLIALFLSAVDPLWAGQHLTLMSICSWAQQAALVLGAALVAAGLVVARLAPASAARSQSRPEASADWFA